MPKHHGAEQQKEQPGKQYLMQTKPKSLLEDYKGSDKLKNKVALITGGDSGIGRAIAYLYAKEGARSILAYLNETQDAEHTCSHVKALGGDCRLFAGDVSQASTCQKLVDYTLEQFGQIDIVVNNAAEQFPTNEFLDITPDQLAETFRNNVFSYFYLTRAALPYLEAGSVIINTTSITAYKGSQHLIDYSATKGAIVSFTRSLALNLAPKNIRVNGVAPGPIWTPLIPASFAKEHVAEFGESVPLGRPGEPAEVAPCYVFLAAHDSNYMTGQVLHPNGGVIVNG